MPSLPELGVAPATGQRGPGWEGFGRPVAGRGADPADAPERTPVEASRRRVPNGWRLGDATLAVAVLVGVVTASNLDRMPLGLEEFLSIRLSIKNALLLGVFAWGWPWVLALCGLYDPTRLRTGRGEWPRLIVAGGVGGALAMIFPLSSASGAVKPIHALVFAVAVAPVAGAARVLSRRVRAWSRSGAPRNVVIVGSGRMACAGYRELQFSSGAGFNVLGFVDDTEESLLGQDLPHLGRLSELEQILARDVVDEVQIALPVKSQYDEFQEAIAVCERAGVDFSYELDTFRHALTRPRVNNGEGRSTVNATPITHVDHLVFKRAFDLVASSVLLLLLGIPIALTALAVKLSSRGPILFAQRRYGRNKRLFTMYKFRSMHVEAEKVLQRNPELYAEYVRNNFKLLAERDPRLTPVGRMLRKTSLDELPQLWNVLRGDMSIVGPRPIVPAEIEHYGAVASLLLALKPGLTSMWVVEGRSGVGYPRRADLELRYVRNWSLLRDLWILFRTVPAVFKGGGAH